MLRFTPLRNIFLVLVLAYLAGRYFGQWPLWPLGIFALVFMSIVAYGSYQIKWNFYFNSINQLPQTVNAVSLTFDDGPTPGKTDIVLDILKKHNAFATFFFIGNRVDEYPELAKRVVDEGHLIGNHSHNHTFMFDLYNERQMSDELDICNEAIEDIVGKKPKLFRPPYGVTNPTMQRVLKKNGMVSVGWSLRSFDTSTKKRENLWDRLKNTKSRDIVLLHEHGIHTIDLLDDYLNLLKQKNIQVKRLDEVIHVNYEEAGS